MSAHRAGAPPSAPAHRDPRTDNPRTDDRQNGDEQNGDGPEANNRPDARADPPDRGVATVLAAALILSTITIVGFGMVLGSVMLARHRADGAADLAALAAASRAQQGGAPACTAAREVAAEARTRLLDCELVGPDARVVVEVRVPIALGALPPQVTGRARAGPVTRSPQDGPR
ncbi:Rv3654c family TadE-like protein [Saccharopolyspora sp. NPDC047091]|uniref:Rv3654c family TadE-like protein n=1 Tax=Saccharopolyspora sp. NPDC047091 TaxID=3155924 RepID=UPI0033F96D4C